MIDLTQNMPPHGPPKTDSERLSRLRHRVSVAAHNEAVKAADCMLFSGVAMTGASVAVLCGLLFVDLSPNAKFWFSLVAFALLMLNFAFNPGRKGLLHSVHEGQLRELVVNLDAIGTPIDAAALTRYESRATLLIARD